MQLIMSGKKYNIDFSELQEISAIDYEQKYVHDVYNNIAQHFSDTRTKPWPLVKQFLESLPSTSIMVDVGCGNGKNLGISPGINIGCDICTNLLSIAKNNGHNVIQCDILNLPFSNSFADAIINIAVIHHLSTHERRLKAVQEMLRILKPNGLVLIYVWAKKESINNDLFVEWKNNKNDEKDYKRYYHFFEQNELEQLCIQAGNCTIEKSYFDKENWAVILRKK
jgi:SAM-dependent methyltransferase